LEVDVAGQPLAAAHQKRTHDADVDTRNGGREGPGVALQIPALQIPEWPVLEGNAGELPISMPRTSDLTPFGPPVSVVIAALDEEKNLPAVFARLPGGLHEVIVVDGHSSDLTVSVARALRRDVRILTQTGKGKGNALAEGFAACTGDIADGSTDPAEIPRFVAALCNGADFVKGSRFAQGGATADMTLLRMVGNRFLGAVVNLLYGTHYTDLCYGYNAFWTRCLPYMRVDCDGFEVETLINVRIAKAGLVVHEVPSYEHARIYGRSHLHAVRDGARVLHTIAAESRRRDRSLRRRRDSRTGPPGRARPNRPQLAADRQPLAPPGRRSGDECLPLTVDGRL
jgi:hypothetical protein